MRLLVTLAALALLVGCSPPPVCDPCVAPDGGSTALGGYITPGPELAAPRAYPVVQPVSDGGAIIAAGYRQLFGDPVQQMELFSAGGLADAGDAPAYGAPNVPHDVLMPSGDVVVPCSGVVARYVPATGLWSAGPALPIDCSDGVAVALPEGRVFVTGERSYSPTGTSFLIAGGTLQHVEVSADPTPRSGAAAALLQDGRVLVVGGTSFTNALDTAAIFDPLQNLWTAVAPMPTARSYATATTLQDGRVIVAGGRFGGATALTSVTEIYDPRTDKWRTGPSLWVARSHHTATLLPDGDVVFVGGYGAGGAGVALVERLSHARQGMLRAGDLAAGRIFHGVALIDPTTLLIAGGASGSSGAVLTTTELWHEEALLP